MTGHVDGRAVAAASGGAALEEGIALAVEDVSKRRTVVHEARYTPVIAVLSRLRDRQSGIAFAVADAGGSGADIGDDEDDEGDFDEEEGVEDEVLEPQGEVDGWELQHVGFTVGCGEAVGVLGRAADSSSLSRIVCGMTPPTSGRVVIRGRVGPSVELATALTQRELHPRRGARSLARFTRVPRRLRAEYVHQAFCLAVGDEDFSVWKGTARALVQRVAVAAALDPFADVLVVDRLPALGDPAFRERCMAQLETAVARGASALVVGTPSDYEAVERLCSRAVWLKDGVVAEVGAAADVLEAFRGEQAAGRQAAVPVQAPIGFNRFAAILTGEALSKDGSTRVTFRPGEDVCLRVHVEVAQPETVISCRLVLRSSRRHAFRLVQEGTLLDRAGQYVVTASVRSDAIEEAEYAVDVGVVVAVDGKQTRVSRPGVTSFSVGSTAGSVQPSPERIPEIPSHEYRVAEGIWEVAPAGTTAPAA